MKRRIKIIIIGICLGFLLLFIKIAFQIPNNIFWQYYLVLTCIVTIGSMAFNLFYNLHYQKKLKAVLPLWKAGHVEEYIARVESMRRNAKGRYANNMLTLNLSAGYCKLEQYDKATELLGSLSNAKLPGTFKLIHRINLCICYFYQRQTDHAMALYESSQKVFNKYRNGKLYGGNIAILDIFAAIGMNDYDRAAELLQTAQSTWDEPRFLDDYRLLEETIHQRQMK